MKSCVHRCILMISDSCCFLQEIDAFVQEFVSVVQRLPSCISALQALSRLPLPTTVSELRQFCFGTEAKFQQLRRLELPLLGYDLIKQLQSKKKKKRCGTFLSAIFLSIKYSLKYKPYSSRTAEGDVRRCLFGVTLVSCIHGIILVPSRVNNVL